MANFPNLGCGSKFRICHLPYLSLWIVGPCSHKNKQPRNPSAYKNASNATLPSIVLLAQMVLAVLNSDPSLRAAALSPEKLAVALQKSKRRSRAHNVPGGIKHLLSDSKRRRCITALASSSTLPPSSHRSHPRLARRRHKVTSPAARQGLAAPASDPPTSQPQSPVPFPINVTFPRRLPDLPRQQISQDVLASLGFTQDVPSQYIRDQMERLGPMYVLLSHTMYP
jgi:hypothetical protein